MSGLIYLTLLALAVPVAGNNLTVPVTGSIVASNRSGYIVSPNFPANYPDNVNGTIVFSIPKTCGRVLEIEAESFDVEYNTSNGYCIDKVSFKIVLNGQMVQYSIRCGPSIQYFNKMLFENTNVTLTFITNGNITKSGFRLRYNVLFLPPPPIVLSFACGYPATTPCLPAPSYNSACKRKVGAEALPRTHPWHVGLTLFRSPNVAFCGGSIIHPCWVLTSASCVYRRNITAFGLRIGTNMLADKKVLIGVGEVIVHPGFSSEPEDYDYDIALIKLGQCLTFNTTVRPACITEPTDPFVIGKQAVAVGWGFTAEDDPTYSQKLQEFQVTVKSRTQCHQQYAGIIRNRMLCAGAPRRSGCYGDTGSALTYRNTDRSYRIVAVSSYRDSCGSTDNVYTNIRHFYDWMSLHVSNI